MLLLGWPGPTELEILGVVFSVVVFGLILAVVLILQAKRGPRALTLDAPPGDVYARVERWFGSSGLEIIAAVPGRRIEARVRMANVIAGILIKERKEVVFSPISHSHPIAKDAGIDLMWSGWYEQDVAILRLCQKLYVLMIPGWDTSVGVRNEITLAKDLGMPIEYLNPNEVMEHPRKGRVKEAK